MGNLIYILSRMPPISCLHAAFGILLTWYVQLHTWYVLLLYCVGYGEGQVVVSVLYIYLVLITAVRNILTVTSWTTSASSSHIRNSADDTVWRMSPPHPLPSVLTLSPPMAIHPLQQWTRDLEKRKNRRNMSNVAGTLYGPGRRFANRGVGHVFEREESSSGAPGGSKRKVQEGIGLWGRLERAILHLEVWFKM